MKRNYKKDRTKFLLWLKEEAKRKGITQDTIANRSGLIRSNVNRTLNGNYPPTLDTLLRLADAIEVYDKIMNLTKNEKP